MVGGWFDSDLTERGIRQAEAIAESLAGALAGAPAEIVTSDLLRARRTAQIVAARLGTDLTVDRDLRQKSYGEAEGKAQEWLRERTIPLPEVGDRLRHVEGIAGAETRMDLAERGDDTNRPLLGVGHGRMNGVLAAMTLSTEPQQWACGRSGGPS